MTRFRKALIAVAIAASATIAPLAFTAIRLLGIAHTGSALVSNSTQVKALYVNEVRGGLK